MDKIKIGENEYKIGPLNAYDLDVIKESSDDKNISKMKYAFSIYLYAIKLYNPEVKMELAEFMKSFSLQELDKKCDELNEVTGVNFILPKKTL